MNTFNMMQRSIELQRERGPLTQAYIERTMSILDAFVITQRITPEEFTELVALLNS